ncbi:N-acetylmuramoyl-L-alanine amidase [Paenimyroides tangerinum]|uniref:N-acetylmuramoyl-L-alanine amidase n=1 Tax=Paenimyroides tangerinum TaxID=2488728 RepID=A0A3P3WD32_9FLAO|nr:N-acetylmuramoyl-L-alanine amidase [Paenimyroides tangerinum]RRJ91539.1 N-acetylmuramoyl-L-alanine amidase [Paenimyroides tangerinum]
MMKNRLILLDNGHGEETVGKRSPVLQDGSQLFEYEFNRDIVKRITKTLDKEKIEYVVLVPELKDISLAERVKRANAHHAECGKHTCLISVHANAGGGTGFEVFTSVDQTKSDEFAQIMFDCFKEEFPEQKMRSDRLDGDDDKESNFYILKNTNCPAMLTESFFMDNLQDLKILMSENGRSRIARAHVNAIKKIVKL